MRGEDHKGWYLRSKNLHATVRHPGDCRSVRSRSERGCWEQSLKSTTRVLRQRATRQVACCCFLYSSAGSGPERWTAEREARRRCNVDGAPRSSSQGPPGTIESGSRSAPRAFTSLVCQMLSNLRGDYDSRFSRGSPSIRRFLRLRLHYIKFEDYLETLSRVYDSYRSSNRA